MPLTLDALIVVLQKIYDNAAALLAEDLKALNMALALRNPPISMKRLEVPWIGQNTARSDDDYSLSDCGAACVAMIANYKGRACSVDDVSRQTGKPKNYISLSFADLMTAAATFGVVLKHYAGATIDDFAADIDAGKPAIVLVNYRSLPATNRSDAKYNGGHYILVVGYGSDSIVYHDPYWPTADGGANRVLTHREFETSYTTIAPNNTQARHSLRLV